MEFTIVILGIDWKVKVLDAKEDNRLKDCMGFTDWSRREVVISRPPENTTLGDPYTMVRKVLRHEIVHAFMFESGLGDDWKHDEYGQEETVVDWIAWHIHRLETVCGNAEGELLMRLLEEQKHERSDADQQD